MISFQFSCRNKKYIKKWFLIYTIVKKSSPQYIFLQIHGYTYSTIACVTTVMISIKKTLNTKENTQEMEQTVIHLQVNP